jgi:alkaline phosphatase D
MLDTLSCAGRILDSAVPSGFLTAFRHGVASADPLPDGVVLWTRCTTSGPDTVAVDWWIGLSPDGPSGRERDHDVVKRGTAEASAEHDFTVHVDVGGLEPATTYSYGFSVGDERSPVGQTRTAPVAGDSLRLGLASCAYWSCGFFNVYANMAARDLDLVVHVGDYIYENDAHSRSRRAVRAHRPAGRLLTLGDYRARYAQYRTDPDLQALHARHPVAAIWDDHELAGGAWTGGAAAHFPRHGSWDERRQAAVRAYREWMPMRRPGQESVYRALHLGPLADLLLLDTRLVGRDRPALDARGPALRVGPEGRSLLGEDQWRWLEAEASASSGRWLLLGNQVMMAPVRGLNVAGGLGVNPGQWDGYPTERRRLYEVLRRAGWTSDVAVLSGDIHSSWAAELPVGAEFVSPSVTTDSFARTVLPGIPGLSALTRGVLLSQNRHLRMADLENHGYVTLDVSPERIQGDWWHVDSIRRRPAGERWAGGWTLSHGQHGLAPADSPAASVREFAH